MSGGSFNYLYAQDPIMKSDLEDMVQELRKRGMYDAADATRDVKIIDNLNEIDPMLLQLWQAIEWHVSNDWSEAAVARAFVAWEESQREKET